MSEEKTPSLERQWKKVLDKTDGIIPKDAIKQWISRIVPVSAEQNELTLAVADTFTKQYIEPRYLVLLGDAVKQALGAGYTVTLIVDPAAAAPKREKAAKKSRLPPHPHPQRSVQSRFPRRAVCPSPLPAISAQRHRTT